MTQGFPTVKLSFFRWLQKHHKNDIDKLEQDNISIFSYAEEFREYVKSEYASNPISMNMSDILSLEFANGEFVMPDAEAEIPAEDVPSEEVAADEVPAEEEVSKETVQPEEETEKEETPAVLGSTETEETETTEETDNNNEITDLLNNLFADDTFKTIIDTDQDGTLSQEEINKYLEDISGIDGNKDDISLEDILGAMENATAKAEEIAASQNPDATVPEVETPDTKVPEVKSVDTNADFSKQRTSPPAVIQNLRKKRSIR